MESSDAYIARRGFGGYTKHFWSVSIPKRPDNRLAWVNRWHNPDDSRHTTPSQAVKFTRNSVPTSRVPSIWGPIPEPPLKCFSRVTEETGTFPSCHSTRCEQWSTLRQILPSKGFCTKRPPQKWGVSDAITLPTVTPNIPKRYPKINSTMTK